MQIFNILYPTPLFLNLMIVKWTIINQHLHQFCIQYLRSYAEWIANKLEHSNNALETTLTFSINSSMLKKKYTFSGI